MPKDTAHKDYAKKLVKIALVDGQVSGERVSAILQTLKAKPPRKLASLLKYFHLYLRREIRHSQISIEYAGLITPSTVDSIKNFLSKNYNRRLTAITNENKKLIAGLRIGISDDVYDTTVASRLEALRKATA